MTGLVPLPAVIGLAGKKGVGKGYYGLILAQAGYQRVSFAAPLKQMVADEEGITLEELEANKALYVRRLQLLGEEKRQEYEDYWVDLWDEIVGPLLRQGINVYSDDTRHPNEVERIRRRGGATFRLNVPYEIRKERIIARDGSFDPAWETHISETNVDLLEGVTDTDGTIRAELWFTYIQAVWHFQAKRPTFYLERFDSQQVEA